MSFYFSYKTLVSNDCKKKLKRLERLCIPYFLWPVIYFFLNKYLIKYFKIKTRITITIIDLKLQLLYGFKYIFSLWYQWNLIFITISFILIILIFPKHYNFILIILSIISFIYQYNGKNFLYFSKYKPYITLSLGRILEILPSSIIGFIIASSGIMKYLKKNRLKTIAICIYLCYLIIFYDIFKQIKGYQYCGIKMFLFSICVFIIFALFPSDKIKNKKLIKFIKQITNHTAGVYYLHIPVFNCTESYIKYINNRTMKGCMINYLICYCFCFIGNLIFGRTILSNLFI